MTLLISNIASIFMSLSSILSPQSEYISYSGRFDTSSKTEYTYSFPASNISISTDSKQVSVILQDYAYDIDNPDYIIVLINDSISQTIKLSNSKEEYSILTQQTSRFNKITLYKKTEGLVGTVGFYGFVCSEDANFEKLPALSSKILFIGNSITCGYGNEGKNEFETFESKTENSYLSYAAITARALHAEFHTISYSGKGICRNWADTILHQTCMPVVFEQVSAMDSLPKYNHAEFTPNLIVINLGTNDFSPPIGMQQEEFVATYIQFCNRLHSLYPEAKLLLLCSQMLEGADRELLISMLRQVQSSIEYTASQICVLSHQGAFGYGSDWHPNIQQHKLNAQELIDFIRTNSLL